MNAVINESLRLFPPVPGNLRRITPPSGCFIGKDVFPGNTIVGYDMYAGGRSPTHFFRPEEFLPERYLPDPPEEFKNDNLKSYQVFSLEPRNFIGKTMAYVEMRLVLAK